MHTFRLGAAQGQSAAADADGDRVPQRRPAEDGDPFSWQHPHLAQADRERIIADEFEHFGGFTGRKQGEREHEEPGEQRNGAEALY
jgi:hypothetical protein